MKGCCMRSSVMAMMVVLVGCASMVFELGYGEVDTSCVNRLIPCLNYLNGTAGDPPESCCNPLRSVIESNPDCLCSLISREGSNRAEQAGIDINEAQQLPGRCGQHVNPLSCLTNNNAAGSRDGVSTSAAATTTRSSTLLQVTTMISIMSAIILHFSFLV